MAAPARLWRGPVTETDREASRLLDPHIRLAMLIGGMLDDGRFQLSLQRTLLNQLCIAIWLVDLSGKILPTNTSADRMLRERTAICEVTGRPRPVSAELRETSQAAITRACLEESLIGTWGNGMALPSTVPDQAAVAYVRPMGNSDRRHAPGSGQGAVFRTKAQNAMPLPVALLSAVTGLTLIEARVALEISQGTPPETIAQQHGLSVHTVRKHLSNAYEKSGLNSQSGLAALINRYRLPVRG